MSFLKKLGEGIKITTQSVVTKIQEHQEAVARQEEKRSVYTELKKKILKNMTLSDMKKICKEFGVEEPSMYEEDFLSGKRYKRRETPRNIYLEHIIYNVYLEQLIEFARRRRLNIHELLKEKREFDDKQNKEISIKPKNAMEDNDEFTQIEITKKKVNELDVILEKIEEKFDFSRIRDENELEGLIEQFLKLKFEDRKIERQYRTQKGNIDIVIDDKYGIELKIVENNKVIENLVGQIMKYVKVFGKNKIAVVILKTPKINIDVLDEYIEHYKEAGAKVLVLDKGTLRRRKSNVKTYKLIK